MTTPIVPSITDEQLAELELAFEHQYCTVPGNLLAGIVMRLRAAEKDAARWRHARKILEVRHVQEGHASYIEYGLEGSEEYNLELDQAIDLAMGQSK